MKNKKLFLIVVLTLFSSQAYALLDDFNYAQIYGIHAGSAGWDGVQPAARAQYLGHVQSIRAETDQATQYMLVTDVNVVGAANARLFLQYSDDNVTWVDANTAQADVLNISASGFKTTGWVNLATGARGLKFFRVTGERGNGVATPSFHKTMIMFNTKPVTGTDLNTINTVTISGSYSEVWTNMPVAHTEFFGLAANRIVANTTNAVQYEFIVNRNPAASAAAAKVFLQYSDDNATWVDLNTSATIGVMSIAQVSSMLTTEWQTLPAGARGNTMYFRIIGLGGNGAADPRFNTILVKFRTDLDTLTDVNISETYSLWATPSTYRALLTNMLVQQAPLSGQGGESITLFYANTTDSNCYRIETNQFVIGAANAKGFLQYSNDNVTWVDANVNITDTFNLRTSGMKQTACYTLAAGAKGIKYFRLMGEAGDGATDPTLNKFLVSFEKIIKDNSAPADNTCDDFILNQNWAVKNDCYFTTNVNIGTGIVYIAANGRIFMDGVNGILYARELNCRQRVGECLNLKGGAQIIYKSN